MAGQGQNLSSAVMAQRIEPIDSLDFFPTPAWATRALMEFVIARQWFQDETCWEPAAGQGHMSHVLAEYFESVYATDIHEHGIALDAVRDFLDDGSLFESPAKRVDWIITNPPFNLASDFVKRALALSNVGVAMLVRTSWAESISRYQDLFKDSPPDIWAVFTERVPMFKGRVDASGSSATSYSWVVWKNMGGFGHTRMVWIPPCRKELERPEDYAVAA